jgi:hypothetical protein
MYPWQSLCGGRQRVAEGCSEACRRLVKEARGFAVEFDPFMANHLPMVLVALDRMGAEPERLGAFYETYRQVSGLKPAPTGAGRITRNNWTTHFGVRDCEGAYRAFFAGEVARLGFEKALAGYLPQLVPGIAASALHALMRLGYALTERDSDEVGVALGYWAMGFLPLRFAGKSEPVTSEPAEILTRLREIEDLRSIPPPEPDLLWRWMREVARRAAFPPVVDWLEVEDDGLNRIAAASRIFMAGTMSFEALHALTGCHWLRLVRPHWPDEGLAVRYFWQAICAVYPKVGMPALPSEGEIQTMRQVQCPPWSEIFERACASNDEHDISLTFSASEEEKHYGDPIYRVIAARRVGLIA